MPDQADDILDRQVYVRDRYLPFGEVTPADARLLAEQFSGLTGGGLEQNVAPVGRGWRDLAELMEDRGADTVAELGAEAAAEFGERLRIVPRGGSWL